MSKTEVKEKTKEKTSKCSKRCSDYDKDCATVKDKTHCFMGTKTIGRADGLCPFIHKEN